MHCKKKYVNQSFPHNSKTKRDIANNSSGFEIHEMRLLCGIILAKIGAHIFLGGRERMESFFFAYTDLAAILDLAFYLKEPLILG